MIFKVAAHTGDNNNGYIAYNTETKEVDVQLNDEEINKRAKEYLTTVKELHKYTDLSLYDTIMAVPASSLENFKLALGYMWMPTGVHIDWSRPVDMLDL